MGAARRLGDNLVDHAQVEEVLRGDLEASAARSRWLASFQRIAAQPSGENGRNRRSSRASLRGRRGPRRVHRPIPFADDRGDDRCGKRCHLDQAARDRLSLAALFGASPGIGAGRIHERG